ncbi:hypothetical protein D3C84_911690 [compost metagenome]
MRDNPRACAFISAMGMGLPNSAQGLYMLCPPLSVSKSAPSRSRILAVAAACSASIPPRAASVWLSLQVTAIGPPTASLTRRSTMAGKRLRASTLPP